jgi:hypothetical protein
MNFDYEISVACGYYFNTTRYRANYTVYTNPVLIFYDLYMNMKAIYYYDDGC